MTARRIPVHVHPALVLDVVGDIVEGQWCDHCLLPSAARWRVAISDRRDPTRVWWGGAVFQCRDCGHQWKVRDHGEPPANVRFV
jgi:hypothetical protein